MKKLCIIVILLTSVTNSFGQNAGIHTTNPGYTLHVVNSPVSGEASLGVNATGSATQALFNLSIDNRIDGNSLSLLKFRVGATGNIFGIPKANLSLIAADAGAGALLMSTNQNSHMHFATNYAERMRITNDGHVAINNTNPSLGWLHIENNDNINSIYAKNSYLGLDYAYAVSGTIINALGAAVSGHSTTGGFNSGFPPGAYGILGTSGSAGTGVGGFSFNGGTAVRAEIRAGGGTAIYSIGNLQFTGIGEAAGKVLTSDAIGNASWLSLAGSHNHFGEVWSGSTSSSGLYVLNNNTTAFATGIKGEAGTGSNQTIGVQGFSNSSQGIGVLGVAQTSGYANYIGNAGVVGSSGNGNGLFGTSNSGYCIYGLKQNFPSFTGTVARFENQNAANIASVVEVVATGSQPALELNNGFIKVSGTNKTAFKHTTAVANIFANISTITYDSPSINDIVIVTHNYTPNNTYLNKAFGVYWTSPKWAVYLEDQTAMPLNISFNVLVIRQ